MDKNAFAFMEDDVREGMAVPGEERKGGSA